MPKLCIVALGTRHLQLAAAAAAKSRQSCLTLCDPINGSPPGSSVPGFSRQEYWRGLPFPSPQLAECSTFRLSVSAKLSQILA